MADTPPAPARGLTPRQEAFVREYLVDFNGAAAARRAGYSERTAREQAADLLTRPHIQAAIQAAQEQRSKQADVDADWIMRRLRKESLRRDEGSSHAARVKALELLGKHVGMFVERRKVEVTGANGEPVKHEHNITGDLAEYTAAFRDLVGGILGQGDAGVPPDSPVQPVDSPPAD